MNGHMGFAKKKLSRTGFCWNASSNFRFWKTIKKKEWKLKLGNLNMNLRENTRWEEVVVREEIVKLRLGTDKAWATIVETPKRSERKLPIFFIWSYKDQRFVSQSPLDLLDILGLFWTVLLWPFYILCLGLFRAVNLCTVERKEIKKQ